MRPIASSSNIGSIPDINRYDFVQTYQRYPAYHYLSAYAQFEHDINENLTAFAELVEQGNIVRRQSEACRADQGINLPYAGRACDRRGDARPSAQ